MKHNRKWVIIVILFVLILIIALFFLLRGCSQAAKAEEQQNVKKPVNVQTELHPEETTPVKVETPQPQDVEKQEVKPQETQKVNANQPPVAVDDTVTVKEDRSVIISVETILGNDSDSDGDTLSIASISAPEHGTLTDNGDGTYTYTPDPNYHGADELTYVLSDGNGGEVSATVSIEVKSVNDAPRAKDDEAVTDEDIPLSITAQQLLDNDRDVDHRTLTIDNVTQPEHGMLTDNSDGTYTYMPCENYHGADVFSYTVRDGRGKTSTANVVVTINAVSDAPIAADDEVSTNEDTVLTILTTDMLANDTDADGDTLSITANSSPSYGVLTESGVGTYSYTPNENYNGSDAFTYTVSDGSETASATVKITVNAVNDAPAAAGDAVTTDQDTPLVLTTALITANDMDIDGDTLTIMSMTTPSHGTISANGDGNYTYTPDPGYFGSDAFDYMVTDGELTSTAAVSVTVNQVNSGPDAVNDAFLMNQDSTLFMGEGSLLGNDTDVEKDQLSFVSTTDPSHGTLTDHGDGTFTYTPDADYYGTDSFTYTITDSFATDTATVTITVNGLPITGSDRYSASAYNQTTKYFSVMSNDTDPDGDVLTLVRVWGGGASKSMSGNRIRYRTIEYYLGWDTFYYEVSDGKGGVVRGTVKVQYGY